MIYRFLNNRLVRLGILILGGYLALQISRNLLTLWSAKDRVAEAETRLSELEQKNRLLKEKQREATTPEFVERQAREKLGLVKKGEVILVLPQEEVKKLAESLREEYLKPEVATSEIPNWQRWWRLFAE